MNQSKHEQNNNIQQKNKQQKLESSPQKRRGRPQKRNQKKQCEQKNDQQQLFSIHDNVFHASILFYTFRIFDKAPTRSKFNPTIGFSIYEKAKIPHQLKKYYNDDQVIQKIIEPYKQNYALKRFFINSLTFGPKCVIDQFYKLFVFILSKDSTIEQTFQFITKNQFNYILFKNPVLQFLDVKTPEIRNRMTQLIDIQLKKLIEILNHTLQCLKNKQKQNKFSYILDSEQDLFERGENSKPKKKVKKSEIEQKFLIQKQLAKNESNKSKILNGLNKDQ